MRPWILNYELREPRIGLCPSCCGEGGWLISKATYWQPEDWKACEECGGEGSVRMKVIIHRSHILRKPITMEKAA